MRLCRDGCVLRGFALGVKEVDQVFYLVWLKDVTESGHGCAAIVNLMFDLLFF
jgi:hypothetical protein